jgi:hypothetical protein
MRSLLSIFLFCIYLISTCGITICKHYCGGKLAVISIYKNASACCGESNFTNTCCTQQNNCCRDEVSFSKILADQNEIITNPVFQKMDLQLLAKQYEAYNIPLHFLQKIENNTAIHLPPNICFHQKLFLQFQQLKLDCFNV